MRLAVSIYCAPAIGASLDALDRKRIIVVADLALACVSSILAGLSWHGGPVALMVLALGVGGVFDCALTLSLSASVRQLRAEQNLTRAAAYVSAIEALPPLVAPALGAFLYSVTSASVIFVTDAASFLVAGSAAAAATWPSARQPTRGLRRLRPFAGAGRGLHFLLADSSRRVPQLAASISNTVTGLATPILVLLLIRVDNGGGLAIGTYNSSSAIGMLLGALLLGRFADRWRRSYVTISAIVAAAVVGRIPFLLSLNVVALAVAGGGRGTATAINNAAASAAWMEKVPTERQGTVFAARRLLAQGPYPIAVVVGGAISAHLGSSTASLAVALGLLTGVELTAAVWIVLSPPARRFLDGSDAQAVDRRISKI